MCDPAVCVLGAWKPQAQTASLCRDLHSEWLFCSLALTRCDAMVTNVGIHMWHVTDLGQVNVCLCTCLHVCIPVCEEAGRGGIR